MVPPRVGDADRWTCCCSRGRGAPRGSVQLSDSAVAGTFRRAVGWLSRSVRYREWRHRRRCRRTGRPGRHNHPCQRHNRWCYRARTPREDQAARSLRPEQVRLPRPDRTPRAARDWRLRRHLRAQGLWAPGAGTSGLADHSTVDAGDLVVRFGRNVAAVLGAARCAGRELEGR
jgi:hypothetical protein